MKKVFLVLILFLNCLCFGQNLEENQVKETINNLFTGMKNADAKMLNSAFSENAILQTISKDGTVKTDDLKNFLTSVSNSSKNDLDERINFVSIQIDGNLASVFTPYEFYFKGKFSHCGANSFQLVKQNNLWKIQYLIDTRRKENCIKE
ncbi:nuclear transport factor 2 family protein [Chryseobacterium luquanense]|uniref:Nuclear transport factor 2 family protein n=1 Tax=Chryseobacterium luquanense TaxID=2983766 RepID=A0ABT3Y462_9FLAO|nr:nuclear transport factor 2 family protein [Chryseobacterium luquanense]MCX8532930.1 nuclear transport factor 2 family protein [Chryseobacterium luquanense]